MTSKVNRQKDATRQLRRVVREQRKMLKAAVDAIPDTWLDPLLTGPTAVVRQEGDYTCSDIEALLLAIKKRVRNAVTA